MPEALHHAVLRHHGVALRGVPGVQLQLLRDLVLVAQDLDLGDARRLLQQQRELVRVRGGALALETGAGSQGRCGSVSGAGSYRRTDPTPVRAPRSSEESKKR